MKTLKVGDKVHWESQAAASWTRKEGEIIEVVPPRVHIQRRFYSETHNVMYDGGQRCHQSYLVEVAGGKTIKAKPKLYWPRASKLIKD